MNPEIEKRAEYLLRREKMSEEKINQRITTEKELELNLSTESHKPWITAIGKALSSPVRIDILNLIKIEPLT